MTSNGQPAAVTVASSKHEDTKQENDPVQSGQIENNLDESVNEETETVCKYGKKGEPCQHDKILPIQGMIYHFYMGNKVQIFVAGLIFFNFFVASANAQIVPTKGTSTFQVFYVFEFFFGFVFTVELIFNMYGSWFTLFWKSGWNWFDFIIVLISLVALFVDNLPGISVLRLFRAFRVFRLFKRIPSLKNIIEGVFASLPGVANAFVVLTILMGIWSIMGVEFFKDVADQEFGTFMKAMFSMWQVMSMDSWASEIGRGIIYGHHMPLAAIYFISYLFVAGIVMTNVIVAILLENYLTATAGSDDDDDEDEAATDDGATDEAATETKKIESTGPASERLEGITKNKLIELVGEVLTEERVVKLERKELMELFCALYSHKGGRAELEKKLANYTAKPLSDGEKSNMNKNDVPMVKMTQSSALNQVEPDQPSATG